MSFSERLVETVPIASASSRTVTKRSIDAFMSIFDQAAAAGNGSSESSPMFQNTSRFENVPEGKFPSLQVSSKRNATKRRKREKTIPPHAMTTSTAIKFKAFHFSPFNVNPSEKSAEEECSVSATEQPDTASPTEPDDLE
jgi:hypothetical protein